jgi:hypothetical protein
MDTIGSPQLIGCDCGKVVTAVTMAGDAVVMTLGEYVIALQSRSHVDICCQKCHIVAPLYSISLKIHLIWH